jgi:plastocyanin
MKRIILLVVFIAAIAALCLAAGDPSRIALPAAASIAGGAPFFSDVRVFNTSYTSTIALTATYRCFLGDCPAQAPQLEFVLAPRESKAFNDMIAAAFTAPNSAGGVEFGVDSGGSINDVAVTSRLYSTAPTSTVGMFIPGAASTAAHPLTFLEQIANSGPGKGFRTNVGAFNAGDTEITATFSVFNGGALLGSQDRQVPAHSGLQINNIFNAINQASVATDNAVIVVKASGDLFTYAAVIDNNTSDPSFVAGAEDKPAPPGFIPPTATPQLPEPTPTSVPPVPTPTPAAQTAIVSVGQGGMNFVDQNSGSSTTTIHVGDTVRWNWVGGFHSTTSGTCSGGNCHPDGQWDSGEGSGKTFSFRFTQAGTYSYFCTVHGASMTGVVQVN